MTDIEKRILQECIKELALRDAKAIDSLAKGMNISQKLIYEFFIEYHKLLYGKLYQEEQT